MATGSGVNQGKTAFLEEFLPGNGDADLATVNRAWNAAGKQGTLSESLFGKIRSKLGLTGKKGTNGRAADGGAGSTAKGKAKSSPKGAKGKRASTAEEAPLPLNGREGDSGAGKSSFVEEMLDREPGANLKAINGAWAAAGFVGAVSPSIFYKVKRELGVAGGSTTSALVKSKPGSASERPDVGQATAEARPELYGETVLPPVSGSESGDRERVLDRVEDRIDDLIGELKQLGGLDDALESLRKARRVVVRSHEG